MNEAQCAVMAREWQRLEALRLEAAREVVRMMAAVDREVERLRADWDLDNDVARSRQVAQAAAQLEEAAQNLRVAERQVRQHQRMERGLLAREEVCDGG